MERIVREGCINRLFSFSECLWSTTLLFILAMVLIALRALLLSR